jgi:hypothetical protein
LRGFDKAKPKQLYRRFVETGGVVEVQAERLVVHFDKRSHNPLLREAALDQHCPAIPWLRNYPITFAYPQFAPQRYLIEGGFASAEISV